MKILNKLFIAGDINTHTHTHSSHDTWGKTQAHRGHGNTEHTHSTLRQKEKAKLAKTVTRVVKILLKT